MTSDMLRKLLVAGAAVAALSVAACGKPAEKAEDAAATAEAAATTATDAGTKWLLVYVDTDPGAATGAASAETYNSQAAAFPAGFGAEHYARWKVDGTLASLRSYGTGSWGDAAATLGAAQQQTFVELAIPRALLGASTTLGVVTFMINEKALAEGTYAGLYAGSFTDGYSPAMPVTKYLRLDLAVPEAPNAAAHEITP